MPDNSGKNSANYHRRWPLGAELHDHGADFRVWAPDSGTVSVLIGKTKEMEAAQAHQLSAEKEGYFSGSIHDVENGDFYQFRLPSGDYPDPASRFQPFGPHGPSQIISSGSFRWSDSEWKGVSREGHILYELHIGTFTVEGTWRSAQLKLPYLSELGVTVLEIMPVADFPGRFGWGYDGVNFFAPTRLYGRPDDFRAFVDSAHALGMGVILDVVYNHVGPDGNYLPNFAENYFTERYKNDWGKSLNFDGPGSMPVREYFVTNAMYWIDEFHLDGLRLDATHQIFDNSDEHLLAEISRCSREIAGDRSILLIGENEPQHRRLLDPLERGGYGLDALWNDDFHHLAIVALTGKREAYYEDYLGSPQEFVSSVKYGFLYQGQRYSWQKSNRGTPVLDLGGERFVSYLENHDQVSNSLRAERLHMRCDAGLLRTMTALLLLGPGTPLLFQGEEFASSSPFLYFADHNPELAKLVREGRVKFLKEFPSLRQSEAEAVIADPENEETFLRCKLNFEECRPEILQLHRDLIALRKTDDVLQGSSRLGLDGAVLGKDCFALRYFGKENDDRLLLFNSGVTMRLSPMPEPLLAPSLGFQWKCLWSSDEVKYGGSGVAPLATDGIWEVAGRSALLLSGEDIRPESDE